MPRTPQVPYQAIADALRARLDAGEWLPGEQLPSARQIGEQFSVSRTTAARAVRVLAAEGRVTVVRNWGRVRRRAIRKRVFMPAQRRVAFWTGPGA